MFQNKEILLNHYKNDTITAGSIVRYGGKGQKYTFLIKVDSICIWQEIKPGQDPINKLQLTVLFQKERGSP